MSSSTIPKLLEELKYCCHSNRKTKEAGKHPDRDAQFEDINVKVEAFQAAGEPVISIDAKKKELLGEFKNGGSDYGPQGGPIEVNAHDFEDKELGKVVPYGVYDIGANLGYVSLGIDDDTGEFVVNAVRCWLDQMGWKLNPGDEAPDDDGRRRRLQWFTAAALEVGPPTTRGRNRSDHSGLPLSARDFEGKKIEGIASPASRRTVREFLDSHRSHQANAPILL